MINTNEVGKRVSFAKPRLSNTQSVKRKFFLSASHSESECNEDVSITREVIDEVGGGRGNWNHGGFCFSLSGRSKSNLCYTTRSSSRRQRTFTP